jgi:hypothetical protein
VLVLVSNQELGTGGPEECSQAKISQVENIIHTCVQVYSVVTFVYSVVKLQFIANI